MQVKYAAGIVKNRVTADRPVTCAIEHVGSVPSSLRFPSGIPMAPYCFSIPPVRQPSSSPHGKFVAHASIALSLDCCSFLFAMCVSKRGKQEANRERGGLCFANDFGTNRTQHAFCFAAFASFALLAPKKRDSCSVFALTSIERTIGRFSEWLDKQSDEMIRSPENEADTGYE